MSRLYRKKLLLLALWTAMAAGAQAQLSISSPYSLYGVGVLLPQGNQSGLAMGGSMTAYRSPYFINPYNPASYTAFDTMSFVFDGAMQLRKGTLSTSTASARYDFGSLSNIAFGFPVSRTCKMSFGLMPYSAVGYNIDDTQTDDTIGTSEHIYSGSGGLNKVYIGTGVQLTHQLSVGINGYYYFGQIKRDNSVLFPDSARYFNTMVSTPALFRKVSADFGLQYQFTMPRERFAVIGFTFSPAFTIHGSTDSVVYNFYRNNLTHRDYPKDTITYVEGTSLDVKMPWTAGLGFTTGSANRWMATADVNYQKWSLFSIQGKAPDMEDQIRFSAGGQYRPSSSEAGKYLQRTYYRAGVRYAMGNLQVNGSRINDFGVSFGIGLPMRKTRSTINLVAEFGSMGTKDNNLIQDKYFRFTLGTALQERWFIKKRYY